MSTELVTLIATAEGSTSLADTLQSLAACDLPPEYRRTYVIENGPPNGAQSVVAHAPECLRAEYVHVAQPGKAAALNHVLKDLGDHCLVFLTDDDLRYDPQILAAYMAAVDGVAEGVVLGGPLRIDTDAGPAEMRLPHLPPSLTGWEPTPEAFAKVKAHFLGANWVAFVRDLRRAGGFDARFGPGSRLNATGQEWTMQQQLHRVGVRFVYVPEAVVWHKVERRRFCREFLLRRHYRMGIQRGIESRDLGRRPDGGTSRMYRQVVKAVGQGAVHGSAYAFWRSVGRNHQALHHEILLNRALGFFRGYHGSRNDAP